MENSLKDLTNAYNALASQKARSDEVVTPEGKKIIIIPKAQERKLFADNYKKMFEAIQKINWSAQSINQEAIDLLSNVSNLQQEQFVVKYSRSGFGIVGAIFKEFLKHGLKAFQEVYVEKSLTSPDIENYLHHLVTVNARTSSTSPRQTESVFPPPPSAPPLQENEFPAKSEEPIRSKFSQEASERQEDLYGQQTNQQIAALRTQNNYVSGSFVDLQQAQNQLHHIPDMLKRNTWQIVFDDKQVPVLHTYQDGVVDRQQLSVCPEGIVIGNTIYRGTEWIDVCTKKYGVALPILQEFEKIAAEVEGIEVGNALLYNSSVPMDDSKLQKELESLAEKKQQNVSVLRKNSISKTEKEISYTIFSCEKHAAQYLDLAGMGKYLQRSCTITLHAPDTTNKDAKITYSVEYKFPSVLTDAPPKLSTKEQRHEITTSNFQELVTGFVGEKSVAYNQAEPTSKVGNERYVGKQVDLSAIAWPDPQLLAQKYTPLKELEVGQSLVDMSTKVAIEEKNIPDTHYDAIRLACAAYQMMTQAEGEKNQGGWYDYVKSFFTTSTTPSLKLTEYTNLLDGIKKKHTDNFVYPKEPSMGTRDPNIVENQPLRNIYYHVRYLSEECVKSNNPQHARWLCMLVRDCHLRPDVFSSEFVEKFRKDYQLYCLNVSI